MAYRCRELDNVHTIAEYSAILCYPIGDIHCAIKRSVELSLLGMYTVCLGGDVEVFGKKIVGKGTTALVIRGFRRGVSVAIKVRRCDANRLSLLHEAEILEKIRGTGIGPELEACLLYTSPSPRDRQKSRMPSSA